MLDGNLAESQPRRLSAGVDTWDETCWGRISVPNAPPKSLVATICDTERISGATLLGKSIFSLLLSGVLDGRDIVLKVSKLDLKYAAALRNEARIYRSLGSDAWMRSRILRTRVIAWKRIDLPTWEIRELPYIVFDRYPSTLQDCLSDSAWPLHRCIGALQQIAETLVRLQDTHDLVHQDLRLANFYPVDGSILLGDFGISTFASAPNETFAGCGWRHIMPREQIDDQIRRENDVYALGMCLLHVLLGAHFVSEFDTRRKIGNTPTLGQVLSLLGLDKPGLRAAARERYGTSPGFASMLHRAIRVLQRTIVPMRQRLSMGELGLELRDLVH